MNFNFPLKILIISVNHFERQNILQAVCPSFSHFFFSGIKHLANHPISATTNTLYSTSVGAKTNMNNVSSPSLVHGRDGGGKEEVEFFIFLFLKVSDDQLL